jgi:hypothetical protein
MLLTGAESYMWNLLNKTSTIAAVNWKDLAAAAEKSYEILKDKYAMDQMTSQYHRPAIGLSWG